ncbi:BON domain-containing protein [Arsukibacterium sp.]
MIGAVNTQEQKALAERIATGTSGVHAVNNKLTVRQ